MKLPPVIDFLGTRQRQLAMGFSGLLVILSLVSLATKGLVLGLDFTGGTQIEASYEKAMEPGALREQLRAAGFINPVVVHFGTDRDLLIRLQDGPGTGLSERVAAAIQMPDNAAQLKRLEFVGPQIGEELRDKGGLGMLAAFAAVMLYVAVRFQYKFAIGAILALVHDVIVTVGFFSVFGFEFDLTVLAAVMAVIGYSINDTIVVFDRVRENFRLLRKADSLEVFNVSLTQTLERTIITGFTVILVLIALFFVGGEAIHNFSIAMLVGVGFGIYSSVYVASSLALSTGIVREDLLPTPKEADERNLLP